MNIFSVSAIEKVLRLSPEYDFSKVRIINTSQDQFGCIYLAHRYGILKYYGKKYTTINNQEIFGKGKEYIKKIGSDNNGKIWALSQLGHLSYQNEKGFFTQIALPVQQKIQEAKAKAGKIWMVSRSGSVFTYETVSKKIDSITTLPDISSNRKVVEDLILPNNQEIIISTNFGRIFKYSILKRKMFEIKGEFNQSKGSIKIQLDHSGLLWILSENHKVFCYNLSLNKYTNPTILKNNQKLLAKELPISIFIDSKSNIWIGTDGDGFHKIDSSGKKITSFHQHNHKKLWSNTITSFYEDKQNNIWVTNNDKGVNVILPQQDSIHYFEGTSNKMPAKILSISQSKDGSLWLGTAGKGLTKFNPKNKETEQLLCRKTGNPNTYIFKTIEDNEGKIWIATYKNGLWIYNPESKQLQKINIQNSAQLTANEIRFLFLDSKNRIWISSNLGIHIYANYQTTLAFFDNQSNGLSGEICESILEDQQRNIWLGFQRGGLYKYHENSKQLQLSFFSQHQFITKKSDDEFCESIRCMDIDSHGILWMINRTGNLIRFDTNNGQSNQFDKRFFSETNDLKALLIEHEQRIWLSSSEGLWDFNPKDSTRINYNNRDGLHCNSFHGKGALRDKNDYLYFGTTEGLIYFHPDKLSKQKQKNRLLIHEINILNQPINILLKDQIQNPVEQIEKLNLEADQNSFSFYFSVVNLPEADHYKYEYKLHGFDKKWITSKHQQAIYTNIPSGNYQFEVRAKKIHAKEFHACKNIAIHIKLAWWKSTYACFTYLIIISSFTYAFYSGLRIRRKLEVKEQERAKEKQLFEFKLNFFAKISHEIKTPLALIIGPIEKLLINAEKSKDLHFKQQLSLIDNNTKRLSRIAFMLSEFRNKELGLSKLSICEFDFLSDVKRFYSSFEQLASLKNINFTLSCSSKELVFFYDREKVEHVFYNLLSNAFKFTPNGGKIGIDLKYDSAREILCVSIKDSGCGIPSKDTHKIFDLFYQSQENEITDGEGIGLSFVKEVMDAHLGKIQLRSSSEGSTFSLEFPTNKEVYLNQSSIQLKEINSASFEDYKIYTPPVITSDKRILLVEDDPEMLFFLKSILQTNYEIFIAHDGKEGMQKAESLQPDLIVSDVLMPVMDGINMTQKLQEKKETAHIPIILLTAENGEHSKYKALQAGAVELLFKPFHINEVLYKIANQIQSRENIKKRYHSSLHKTNKKALTKEELFLKKITGILKKEISNSDFKLENLTTEMNMSYSVIYRKHQSITGESLISFFRKMRLKKAAYIMCKQNYSVAETSAMVGFNDPLYFSKCFKKELGLSPKIFKNEALKQGIDQYLKQMEISTF